jgi:hypothetical protein
LQFLRSYRAHTIAPLVFNILLLFGPKYVHAYWETKIPERTPMMRALINLGELGNKKGFAEAPAQVSLRNEKNETRLDSYRFF